MKISEFIEESMLDYPGKLSAVLFTPYCNYKCPACHAKQIISGEKDYSETKILKYLDSKKKWIDGVVLCGGEPTLQLDLHEFLKKIKGRGLAVKLDTNGSNPKMLSSLMKENLLDYIAMDIKGPPSLYYDIVGKLNSLVSHVEKSIEIVQKAPDYEFRTTVAPIIKKNGKMEWMTKDEAREMTKWVYKNIWSCPGKWYIQKFVARSKDEMLDEMFCKENLTAEMHETPHAVLEMVKNEVGEYFSRAKIRE